MSLATPCNVNVPVTSAVVTSPSVFTLASDFASKVISGYLATSSHLSLWRWVFCIGLGTVMDSLATTILPVVAPGFSGSKLTEPLPDRFHVEDAAAPCPAARVLQHGAAASSTWKRS